MSYKNAVNSEAQDLLTIFVETLTGATFEIKVSSQDRVKSIKSKIQRVEGIPVSHQHLLYNSKELEDSSCVTDPSVALHDRATVKLVLSMRGGPISLVHQAVPLNRGVLKNYVKLNRENLLEDLPPGCKMAILVLRVGDQLNLLHVVDDGDESCDALSNGKDNLSIDSLEGESSKTLEENIITLEKVCDLKERMEKLSLQRKTQKTDFTNQESSSSNVAQPSKSGGSFKLPSIDHQVRGEMLKSRSEFSQVPVLPDIVPQPFKNASRDLEYVRLDEETASAQICDSIRPKTCPGSLTESQFYNVFSEDGGQNPLQIAQPHFRSCVSACTSKLHHEWGGRKTFLQSLNVLPPITSLPEVLNSHRQISNSEPRSSAVETTAVPSIEKLKLRHRNLSNSALRFKENLRSTKLKLKENLKKESQSSFSRNDSPFFNKNIEYSQAIHPDGSSSNLLLTSSDTCELFPNPSKGLTSSNSSTDLAFCEFLDGNTKNCSINKKNRLRCSECKKRLSLTSTFECRCGSAFCSYHRYSETHHCTYDFKKESRKMLEQANPSVVAPKLPKI